MFELEVQNASDASIPSSAWLLACADIAYEGEREASAVLRIVNTDEAQILNRDYRDKDYAWQKKPESKKKRLNSIGLIL